MAISVDACVAQHIGDREEQQDRAALIPHPTRPGLLLAVIADGMGGHSGGAIAAEQVIHQARNALESYSPLNEKPQDLLRTIIEEAHVTITLSGFTSEKDPHSTATLLLLQPGRVDWASCGDSRIYHFHWSKVVAKSADHSLVAELVRQGRISEAEAETHPRRNMLLSCLGSEDPPDIGFGEAAPLTGSDTFLLCSDGLWGYVSDDEMAHALAVRPAREAAELLIQRARERGQGKGDNISLVIVKLVEKTAVK